MLMKLRSEESVWTSASAVKAVRGVMTTVIIAKLAMTMKHARAMERAALRTILRPFSAEAKTVWNECLYDFGAASWKTEAMRRGN